MKQVITNDQKYKLNHVELHIEVIPVRLFTFMPYNRHQRDSADAVWACHTQNNKYKNIYRVKWKWKKLITDTGRDLLSKAAFIAQFHRILRPESQTRLVFHSNVATGNKSHEVTWKRWKNLERRTVDSNTHSNTLIH